jgi:hypothetical protein
MRSGFRMNRATPKVRSLARDLIDNDGSETLAADFVIEKLRPPLANLMGIGGFRALLLRALRLAGTEISWLGAVDVKADGTLEGLHLQIDRGEFLEGRVVLLAHLLGLLVAFIGPALTSRLLAEIWPKFPSTTRILAAKEAESEKAK